MIWLIGIYITVVSALLVCAALWFMDQIAKVQSQIAASVRLACKAMVRVDELERKLSRAPLKPVPPVDGEGR